MGGSGLSREKFNARETILSSDFNRLEALASRELQNVLADASTDVAGLPITGLSGPCSLAGIAAQFNMALSAQQAFCYDPSDSSLTADDSAYEVARWAAQNLLFANPPGSNARIDLVVVTPAAVDTDSQSRNILVDPVARTISPQNVFKTTNPLCVPQVVTGTAGATPVPPAVPAGAFALFEVTVPSGATDSTGFGVTPRMFRRAPFPWATLSGIVSGFKPQWDLTADPTTTASTISFGALDDCRIVIDGELIETLGAILEVFQDGAANPFGSAASAVWNRPYYLYAVGGRHAPQKGVVFGSPVIIVESTTPPFLTTGRPTAAITTARGSAPSSACVYIGLGSVVANTTRRAACFMDDSYTYHVGSNFLVALNNLQHVYGGAATAKLEVNSPPVVPAISSRAVCSFLAGTGTGTSDVYPDQGDGTAPSPGFSATGFPPLLTATAGQIPSRGVLPMNAALPTFWAAAAGAGTLVLAFAGFDHGVKRLR
jgi:hypothetical protein